MALRRPYIVENYLYVPAATGGWNPDANPWELGQAQAAVLDNFIVRPGKLALRGSMGVWYDYTTQYPLKPIGAVAGIRSTSPDQPWLLQGNAATLGTDAADAAWGKGSSGFTRTVAGGTLLWTTGPWQNPTAASFSAVGRDQIPGPRWVNHDGLLYGLGFDSATAAIFDTNTTYSIPPIKLLTLPLLQTTVTVPTQCTVAPQGAIDLTSWQSRIWLAQGADTPGGSAVHQANAVYFTNAGASGVGTTASADWKDPITGLTNQIIIDRNQGDPIVGFGRVRNALVVFRHNSIYRITGTTPNNTVTLISQEIGCVDQRSIVETDDGVYFLSPRGLMRTDGLSVHNMSGPIEHTLTLAIQATRARSSQNGFASMALLSDGSLIMSMGLRSNTAGSDMSTTFAAVFNRATGTFWRPVSQIYNQNAGGTFDTNVQAAPTPPLLFGFRQPGLVISVGNKYLTVLENSFFNQSIVMPDRATLYDQTSYLGSTFKAIQATWRSHMLPTTTGELRRSSKADHFYMDYLLAASTMPSAQARPAFTATIKGGNFATQGGTLTSVTQGLRNPQRFVSAVDVDPQIQVQRVMGQTFFELNDAWLEVTFDDSFGSATNGGIAPMAAEVYGAGVSILPGPTEPVE